MESVPNSSDGTETTNSPGDIDDIYISLRDLDNAKASLQKEFKKLLEEHKVAEVKTENVRKSASQASDLFMKAQENLNVMKMKLDSLTSSILSLESFCQGLREMICVLQDKLRNEKIKQVNSLNSFEAEIEDLKKKFVNAVLFYAAKQLTSEIAKQESQYQETYQKRKKLEGQLHSAEVDLKNQSSHLPLYDHWQEIVTNGQRDFLMKILLEEQCRFQHAVNAFQQKKNKAHLILQQQNVEVQVVTV